MTEGKIRISSEEFERLMALTKHDECHTIQVSLEEKNEVLTRNCKALSERIAELSPKLQAVLTAGHKAAALGDEKIEGLCAAVKQLRDIVDNLLHYVPRDIKEKIITENQNVLDTAKIF